MSAGIALIFAGYLKARSPETEGTEVRGQGSVVSRRAAVTRSAKTENRSPKTESPALAFIESRLASLSDDELSAECAVWSVPAREIEAFSRAEARRVWSFRNRLTPDGQSLFDTRPPGIRLQLAELYFDVMSADITSMELAPVAPVERRSSGDD